MSLHSTLIVIYIPFYFEIYIGAAVYIALEKFDESITDCDRAQEINNKFAKVRKKRLKRIELLPKSISFERKT
jgi:hypothetical protein